MVEESVRFEVGLKDGVDGYSVKSELEQLADDLFVNILELENLGMQLITGETNKTTYEQVFDAEIEYITRTINNINTGPYDVQEWSELKRAKVPEALADKIEYIRLEMKMYLTD